VASVEEKVFSFLASCQMVHNLNISTIDFCNVLYMTALFDEGIGKLSLFALVRVTRTM